VDFVRIEGVDADAQACPDQLSHHVRKVGERHARSAADVDDVGAASRKYSADLRMAVRVIFGALLISARISMSHVP
jgi:hypothetical protein